MARSKKEKEVRSPVEEGEGKSRKGGQGGPVTSRNREESMTESGDDAFQNPRTSGTISLGGESGSADPDGGPGGVEGTRGDE